MERADQRADAWTWCRGMVLGHPLVVATIAVVAARMALLPASSFGWYMGFNEGFYAQMAAELLDGAATPTYLGNPNYNVPALTPYLMAGSFAILGMTEFAARLPSLLFLPALAAGVWLLARRLYADSAEAARRSVLLALTTPAVLLWFGRAQTDGPLTACLVLTLAGLVHVERRWGWTLAAVSFAVGLMAKQPILAVAAALPFLEPANRWRGVTALAAGLAPAATWWLWQVHTHPAEVVTSLVYHVHERSTSGGWQYAPLMLAFGFVVGGASSFLITPRVRWRGVLVGPLVLLSGFALIGAPNGHDYYALPAVALLAVAGGSARVGPRAFRALLACNLLVACLVFVNFGEVGDTRTRDLGVAFPEDGIVLVPDRLGPQLGWYSGRPIDFAGTDRVGPQPGRYVVSFDDLRAACPALAVETYLGSALGLYDCRAYAAPEVP